jgi:Transposase and inactivated derivatives
MRQTHIAGEKLFVDFAGRTGEVVDGLTGEIIPVQIFVAVLGASNFTYAEAVWSQKLPDWIAAHVRAFAYFGGVARQTVSDNLKAGSPRPASMSRRSTGPTPTWRGITAPPSFQRALTSRATRQKSKSAFRSSGAGSWHAYGIGASSRWPSSMPQSAPTR